MAWTEKYSGVQFRDDEEGPASRLVKSLLGIQERKRVAAMEEERMRLAREEAERIAKADAADRALREYEIARQLAATESGFEERPVQTPVAPGGPAGAPDELGFTDSTPAGTPATLPLGGMERVAKPARTFSHPTMGELPLPNRETVESERTRAAIQSGKFLPITPDIQQALQSAPPALRSLLLSSAVVTEDGQHYIPESRLSADVVERLLVPQKPVDPFADVQNVPGGYLTRDKDGQITFHRTASESQGPSGVLIPVTDATGTITGFYNNRTGEYQPGGSLPGGARRAGVPAGEMAQRGALESLISDAEQLKLLASGEAGNSIGWWTGKWEGATRSMFKKPQDVQDLFHIADNLSDMLLRARSGAQINEQEYQRLRGLVPNPRDNKSKFDADLERFLIESRNILSARKGGPVTQVPRSGLPEAPNVDWGSIPDQPRSGAGKSTQDLASEYLRSLGQ